MAGAITMCGGLRGAYRLVIEPTAGGAYLFVFETEDSRFPEQDRLQGTVADAKAQALEDFGAPFEAWTGWGGPSLV